MEHAADLHVSEPGIDGLVIGPGTIDSITPARRTSSSALGIYTHADKNVPGSTGKDNEPASPPSSLTRPSMQTATNLAFALRAFRRNPDEKLRRPLTARPMVGLAYWANVGDIRPDVAGVAKTQGKQTIRVLLVDVLEQPFVTNNQFYLTASTAASSRQQSDAAYSFANTTPLDQTWWSTNGETLSGRPP